MKDYIVPDMFSFGYRESVVNYANVGDWYFTIYLN